jgi:hypothetical protein
MPKTAIPGVGWFSTCQDTEGNIFGITEENKMANYVTASESKKPDSLFLLFSPWYFSILKSCTFYKAYQLVILLDQLFALRSYRHKAAHPMNHALLLQLVKVLH